MMPRMGWPSRNKAIKVPKSGFPGSKKMEGQSLRLLEEMFQLFNNDMNEWRWTKMIAFLPKCLWLWPLFFASRHILVQQRVDSKARYQYPWVWPTASISTRIQFLYPQYLFQTRCSNLFQPPKKLNQTQYYQSEIICSAPVMKDLVPSMGSKTQTSDRPSKDAASNRSYDVPISFESLLCLRLNTKAWNRESLGIVEERTEIIICI